MTRNRIDEELLTPGEVAAIFRVDPKTVARWADMGLIRAIRTLGGHRRYSSSEITRLLERRDSVEVPQQRLSS
jgi:excisionase family DNA binding protein